MRDATRYHYAVRICALGNWFLIDSVVRGRAVLKSRPSNYLAAAAADVAARHAGRVNVGPTVRRSNVLVSISTFCVRGETDWNYGKLATTDHRESGFYEFYFLIHEFYWILKMLSEFYFKIQYFNFLTEKLQPHFFAVSETLNSDESDSNQCYSESESATAHCSHSTVDSAYR